MAMRGGGRSSSASSSQSKPKALDRQWVPLQTHPVFRNASSGGTVAASSGGGNLAAWDPASSRLYLWDPKFGHLHRLSLRFSDDLEEADGEGASSSPSLLAACPSEVLTPDIPVKSDVHRISINADGSVLILSSTSEVWLMNLHERASSSSSSSSGKAISYRASNVGSQIFSSHNSGLQVLQVSWHPYSTTHVGILSSDSVLRLFDLSSDLELPEQEFYLQPFEVGNCHNAVSICPVAFSFGDQHFWDRFSIFVLFSDGSIYVLCPVIPFGSVCSLAFLEELHEDVKEFGLKQSNANVIGNFNLALDWLESTFPELADQPLEKSNRLFLIAHPYALLDASVTLQGPLGKVCSGDENDDIRVWSADCEGRAISLLYSCIGKDSVLMIGWSSGQIHVDALADEVQPLWNVGSPPRLRVGSYGRIKGVAMICESYSQELSGKLSHQWLNSDTTNSCWLGPPLLRLNTIDLALPQNALDNCSLTLFPDPLLAGRFYCLHGAGIDLISLQFLPFSKILGDADKIEKEPSVLPILTTAHGESCSTSGICGFVSIADTCGGHSQLVGITSSYECILMESMFWTKVDLLPNIMDIHYAGSSDTTDTSEVISNEILSGPKAIVIPPSTSLKSLSANSIEGRSTLHQYYKLFHENYVEYAHKVFVELENHEDYLKMNIDNQNKRLHEAKQLLLNAEGKQHGITDRISRALKVCELLEQRLQNFRTLPAANKKPLSRAEREFKNQLETFADVELDALHSSIDVLNARVRRCFPSTPVSTLNVKGQPPGRRNQVSDGQMQKIRASLERLSIINNENTKRINLIEHGLKRDEE